MNEEKKVGKFKWEEKNGVKETTLLIVGGVFTAVVIGLSYTAGTNYTLYKMQVGLDKMIEHDPTLESHFNKVIDELKPKMK